MNLAYYSNDLLIISSFGQILNQMCAFLWQLASLLSTVWRAVLKSKQPSFLQAVQGGWPQSAQVSISSLLPDYKLFPCGSVMWYIHFYLGHSSFVCLFLTPISFVMLAEVVCCHGFCVLMKNKVESREKKWNWDKFSFVCWAKCEDLEKGVLWPLPPLSDQNSS